MDLFQIPTARELHFILQLQRAMARQAAIELDEIVKSVATPANHHDEEYLASASIEREVELLRRYAAMPTLSEHAASPALQGAYKPGATFAVATLIGETVLAHMRALNPNFLRVHRTLLMITLSEFHKPVSEDSDLVDTLTRVMRFELDQGLGEISEEERQKLIRAMLRPLAETILMVSAEYALVTSPNDEGWVITELGTRVMAHLFDAHRFIDSVAAAHKRLQAEMKQS